MVVLCQLKELSISCFGCCGNSYSNKKEIIKDLRKNTLEFDKSKKLSDFMKRTNDLKDSGVCANVIYKEGKYFCPGHPALNKKMDFRNLDPDCEKDYVCKTYSRFYRWNKEKQNKFLSYLKSKKLDSYTYSIKMDNNSLLGEFEKKIKQRV